MPFTPLHLGPGALFKAIGGTRFSFMVFGGTQVLMDVEVLVRMSMASARLHGLSHTLLGALVIGAFAAATGKPITQWVLRAGGAAHHRVTWAASTAGAFVGSFSHIFLDAIMHGDMEPLWPLGDANPLLALVSLSMLFNLCLATGAVGGIVVFHRIAAEAAARRQQP
jgi:membrane-bound metal-dependent hydrolase YbcI (DUF457 family)